MKKLIILYLLINVNTNGFCQKNMIEERFKKLQLELQDKYPQIDKGQFEITIFGNSKCNRCSQIVNILETNKMQFIEFDLRINKNAYLMRKLCYKKSNKTSINIKYPVIIINNMVFFEIDDINKFGEDLVKKYKNEKTTYSDN